MHTGLSFISILNTRQDCFAFTTTASLILTLFGIVRSAEMLGIEPELLREEHKVKKLNRFDGQEFPDPSSWTVDQVYQFIRTADGDMYANGAEAFRREVSSFFFFFF